RFVVATFFESKLDLAALDQALGARADLRERPSHVESAQERTLLSPRVVSRRTNIQFGLGDFLSPRQYARALDAIFELPDVAWPIVFFKAANGAAIHLQRGSPELASELRGKEFRQLLDVRTSIPQCRYVDREHGEPEVQVFSELLCRHSRFQVPVGRSN